MSITNPYCSLKFHRVLCNSLNHTALNFCNIKHLTFPWLTSKSTSFSSPTSQQRHGCCSAVKRHLLRSMQSFKCIECIMYAHTVTHVCILTTFPTVNLL